MSGIIGNAVFAIYSQFLDFKMIAETIGLLPTKIIRRGDLRGVLKNIPAPYDVWMYEINMGKSTEPLDALNELIDAILPFSEEIKSISEREEDVVISCYIRSEVEQFGFSLNPKLVEKVAKIGVRLDFHFLSFGESERTE